MKAYTQSYEYIGNSYQISVKRHDIDEGTLYIVKLTSSLLLEHSWMKKVTFDINEICDKFVVELIENFEAYVDGLDMNFDETMLVNKFSPCYRQ